MFEWQSLNYLLDIVATSLSFEGEMLLSDALRQAEARHFDMPCGGNRTCGKCRVQAQGVLSAYHEFEELA